jgi:hypothetical protein
MIKDILQQKVEMFSSMKHPSILEMFVLRNGKIFEGAARPKGVRKRENKMCFMNSTKIMWELDLDYYEGFAVSKVIGFPIHHAWNLKNNIVVDTTWKDPQTSEYMGVLIPKQILNRELAKHGYYGVLSNDITYNFELIFEMDPGLKEICEKIAGRPLNY